MFLISNIINKINNIRAQKIVKKTYDLNSFSKNFVDAMQRNADLIELSNKYYNNGEIYPLECKCPSDSLDTLWQGFFLMFNQEKYNYLKSIYPDKINVVYGTNPNISLDNKNMELTNYIDLRDLYSLIDNFTYLLINKNGNNATREIISETIVYAMERCLETYLLSLSEIDLYNNHIDKNALEDDIKKRRISTFFRKYNSIVRYANNNFSDNQNDINNIVSIMYSNDFSKLAFEEQVRLINLYIDLTNRNSFHNLIYFLPSDMTKNNANRTEKIDEIISKIKYMENNQSNIL